MGTVKNVYGISGKVEVMFIRLMRSKLYCLGRIFSPQSFFSTEVNKTEYL